MARQAINIGQAANDNLGEPLRTAFDKCNRNFEELYLLTQPPVAKSGDMALTAAQSHGTFTNFGAVELITFTLPEVALGLTYTFVCAQPGGIRIKTFDEESQIRIGAATSTQVATITTGDSVTLMAVSAGLWIAIATTGTGWGTA